MINLLQLIKFSVAEFDISSVGFFYDMMLYIEKKQQKNSDVIEREDASKALILC